MSTATAPGAMTGRIVTASWEHGTKVECELEDCECPEHERPPSPRGLYVTVQLDDDTLPVGLWDVTVTRVHAKDES